jgi:hypothetical protein
VELGQLIGFDRQQVSKWNWDHRKKNGFETSRRAGQLGKDKPKVENKREVKAATKKVS